MQILNTSPVHLCAKDYAFAIIVCQCNEAKRRFAGENTRCRKVSIGCPVSIKKERTRRYSFICLHGITQE